jgi:hypothetical protein
MRFKPPKRRLIFTRLHDVISQNIYLFITTAVRASNSTQRVSSVQIPEFSSKNSKFGVRLFVTSKWIPVSHHATWWERTHGKYTEEYRRRRKSRSLLLWSVSALQKLYCTIYIACVPTTQISRNIIQSEKRIKAQVLYMKQTCPCD